MCSKLLGAGRLVKDGPLDRSVGIVFGKKIGDRVEQGEPLADFHTDGDPEKLSQARERFIKAYTFGLDPVKKPRLILARVDSDGVQETGQG